MSVEPHRVRCAILAAIIGGATMDALLDRWSVSDIADVMRLHHFTVTDNGQFRGKDGGPVEASPRDLLALEAVKLAEQSPNPHVRRAARDAALRLARLSEVLELDRRVHRQEEFLQTQIDAAERWRDWLREAQRDISAEVVKLKQRRRKRLNRAAVSMPVQVREAS